MLCIANTRRIVLQSRSLVHNSTLRHFGPRDSKTIFESKIAQFSGVIKSQISFKHGLNFGRVSLNY